MKTLFEKMRDNRPKLKQPKHQAIREWRGSEQEYRDWAEREKVRTAEFMSDPRRAWLAEMGNPYIFAMQGIADDLYKNPLTKLIQP